MEYIITSDGLCCFPNEGLFDTGGGDSLWEVGPGSNFFTLTIGWGDSLRVDIANKKRKNVVILFI